ncbi:hypothetical protein TNCV_4555471 [Trichonephila clavipes]|nr:hypothetical protein TNCV_4555471 [Trichonephila clavipes]
MMDTLGEEAPVFVVELIFNSSLDLISRQIAVPSELSGVDRRCIHKTRDLGCKEDVREPSSGIAERCLARHIQIKTSIIMGNDNLTEKRATSAALDILSQFTQRGTVSGSIDCHKVWRNS